jgi:hypothetical protein
MPSPLEDDFLKDDRDSLLKFCIFLLIDDSYHLKVFKVNLTEGLPSLGASKLTAVMDLPFIITVSLSLSHLPFILADF